MTARPALDDPLARRTILVHGLVQGVGFRPFVYRLATDDRLSGWVRNDPDGVHIEVQGTHERVERFLRRLRSEAPSLARVDDVEARERPVLPVDDGTFRIERSRGGAVSTAIVPDAAICDDCLAELLDPANRRWRYPFVNCTHCGPRYTITAHLPYDRPNTSMARFALCDACAREYRSPLERRFHAQPNACPACGPRLRLLDVPHDPDRSAGPRGGVAAGRSDAHPGPSPDAIPDADATPDPIAGALARMRAGGILAIKGLGGFHLACDASDPAAVARLRRRKLREEKPFAVMAVNVAALAPYARVDEASAAVLRSRERPIVLLDKTADCDRLLPGVSDGMPQLGAMLPYTPLHYLLFHEAAGRPAGTGWMQGSVPLVLVMTSANPGGEPLAIGNDEAIRRLSPTADAFLLHDREILVRCDDSVLRARPAAQFVRRARGFTPAPIRLPRAGPPVLALGAHLKNTICVTRGDQAFLSQHVGDLDNAATCEALESAVEHLLSVLEVRPERVAHDLHPDFFSTRFAARWARERGLPCVAVQHHRAHVAAVAAEHRVDAPVLGLALDGVGLGDDGRAWGGELLALDARGAARVGHLREIALPGGDRAAREPWRMAAAALHLVGRADQIERRFARQPAAAAVRTMLERGFNCPPTSSLGRWFDAVAGLLGVTDVAGFEGQAPMLLEGLARTHGEVDPVPGDWAIAVDGTLDLTPLVARLADEPEAARGAARFHASLARALADWAIAAARRLGHDTVALGGGCMLNAVLAAALRAHLRDAGLRVLEARLAPPNDGGVSLGQAWAAIAAAPFAGED